MNLLPDPLPGHLWLVVTPWGGASHAASGIMLDLIARLAQRGPVSVIDGNNRFNAHYCSRAIAHDLCFDESPLQRPRSSDVTSSGMKKMPSLSMLLNRIYVARAFTCYQMLTLLSEMPTSPAPALALDFLATFYDENVPAIEARRLLETCVAHLRRLSIQAPVLVSARPLRSQQLSGDRYALLDVLAEAAQRVWTLEEQSVVSSQLSFPL